VSVDLYSIKKGEYLCFSPGPFMRWLSDNCTFSDAFSRYIKDQYNVDAEHSDSVKFMPWLVKEGYAEKVTRYDAEITKFLVIPCILMRYYLGIECQ